MDVDIATRSQQWCIKKSEKLRIEKEKQETTEKEKYNFAPKINNDKKKDEDKLYSSSFVQQGLVAHFSRIEKAKKEKEEKIMRLNG